MAFRLGDRVKETSTTTGTGTYSLDGASTGFRTFVAGIGTTNRCTYVVTNDVDWEINEGVITDATPDTLTRDKLLASSTGSAINWAAGTRRIFVCEPGAARNPMTKRLSADHTLAATTGTEVVGLDFVNLRPGTYHVRYYLKCSSSAAATGIGIGVNFTGTAANPSVQLYHPTTGAAAATGTADGTTNVLTGTLVEGRAQITYSTTAPNMLSTGVATAGEEFPMIVEALIDVTIAGDLELWHSSETAANTTVKAGSVAILTRIDD